MTDKYAIGSGRIQHYVQNSSKPSQHTYTPVVDFSTRKFFLWQNINKMTGYYACRQLSYELTVRCSSSISRLRPSCSHTCVFVIEQYNSVLEQEAQLP